MKYIIILIGFLIIITVESILGTIEVKKTSGTINEKKRIRVYKSSIISGIIITSLCLIVSLGK